MTKVRRPKILSVSWPISPWVKKFGALEQPLDVNLTFSSPTFALFAQKWRELWQQVLHRSLASKVSLVRRCLLSYVGVSHQTSLLKHLSSQCPCTLPPHQIPCISRYGHTGCFLHWASPQKLKYGKPRLGESTLT